MRKFLLLLFVPLLAACSHSPTKPSAWHPVVEDDYPACWSEGHTLDAKYALMECGPLSLKPVDAQIVEHPQP